MSKVRSSLDLEELIRQLKSENNSYRLNFEELKRTHGALQEKYDSLELQLKTVVAEKTSQQSQHDSLVNEWRVQLQKKSEEFDRLRQQLQEQAPPNLDLFRHQVLEEYREHNKKQHVLLKEEVQKQREQVGVLVREVDDLKMALRQKDLDYQGTLEDMAAHHQQELLLMQLKLKEKNDAVEETVALAERLRQTQRENGEQALRIRSLMVELEDVRSKKEEERVQAELQARTMTRTIQDQETQAKVLLGEKEALKTKLRMLTDEHQATLRRQDELLTDHASLTKQLGQMQINCDQLTHQFRVESSAKDLALLQDRNKWSTERDDLNKEMASRQQEIADLKQMQTELTEKLVEKEREMERQVRVVREEEWAKARLVEQQRRDVEEKLAKAQQLFQNEQKRMTFEKKEAEKDVDLFRKEVQALQLRNQSITAQMEKMAQERDQFRQEFNELHQRYAKAESERSQIQMEMLSTKKREEGATTSLRTLEHNYQSLQKELIEHIEAFEKEKARLSFALEEQARHASQEAARAHAHAEDQTQEIQAVSSQLEQVVATAKKLKQGYKKRLEDAHSQIQKLTRTIQHRDTENQALRTKLDNENQATNLKLRQVQRKQEEFLTFLQHEGVAPTTQKAM